MDEVLWKGLDVLTHGQDITGLRKMVLVSFMRRHFQMEEAIVGSDFLSSLLSKLPSQELSAVADIAKGKTGIKDAKSGPYPLVVTAEARGECDHFDYEGPSVLIPMVSSTGHGDASLKRIHYQEGQYAVGSILAVVRPLDPEQLSARYLYEYLSAFKDELLVSRMVGTANVSLTVKKLGDVPVPLIPIESQNQVERLMALCDRLEADQADAEAAHAQLVQALLGSLTQATDAADFRASWQRLSEHFHTLFTTEASIDALKQAVLQLAVMGCLCHWGPDQPQTSAQASSSSSLPAHWVIKLLHHVASEIVDCPHSTPQWTPTGEICVRTSQFKAGLLDLSATKYVSRETFEERIQRLAPAEGDILYSREGGILGVACRVPPDTRLCLGQRMMLIRPGGDVDGAYLEIVLNSPQITQLARSLTTGGAAPRVNVSAVKSFPIPLPPLAEQRRIVAKVDELMARCDQLKAELQQARQQHAKLADALVSKAVA
jgi:type I restriction enzyme S subunit